MHFYDVLTDVSSEPPETDVEALTRRFVSFILCYYYRYCLCVYAVVEM